MIKRIMSIFTRSPLHVGAGNSVGAIDSPIMRERHTRHPIIPGSSLKGVLADFWIDDMENGKRKNDAKLLFGSDDANSASAGQLLIGEGRILCFPVRSAKNAFAWITCPLALSRFARDAEVKLAVPEVGKEDCFASDSLKLGEKVVLEEYCLTLRGGPPKEVIDGVSSVIDGGDDVWKSLPERLAIVSDEMFSHFAEQACEVVTRVRIDDEKGTVVEGALFNQEQVPSEAMFYAVVAAQDKRREGRIEEGKAALDKLGEKLRSAGGVLQIGGDETIGLGYCSVILKEGE